ncbi:HEPN domain-containing protein [Vibrio furnissii]|uniref:HEPN domain-containing protein n=1 Tax=Vibrio furnissii TaxID=29494 RepID=UPI001EEA7A94|nr:HEPN domain-containing protein [Vibrio furnissii]MCG6232257.1 HEPN domain-containing protein [Vibrio furnissii]MCG6258736.1 HEPN domain-containing protein [Vibrio furnissii]
MARNYVTEIREKYSNLYEGKDRWEQLSLRIDPLLESIVHIRKIPDEDVRDELLRGSIIGIVSCLEGYFRLAIRDIIDSGKPFDLNANKVIKNKKISTYFDDPSVTKGDLVAHTISINNLSSLNKILSELLDIDFWESLQVNEVLDDEDTLLRDFNPNLFEDIESLFSFRHMFAHELASDVYIELDDVDYFVSAGFLLIHVSEELIETCLSAEDFAA